MKGTNLNLERAVIIEDEGWEKPKGQPVEDGPGCIAPAQIVYNTEGCGYEEQVSTWKDKTACVPLALAALLIAYVEDECDGPKGLQKHIDATVRELVDHPDDPMRTNHEAWIGARSRMLRLYRWWTEERPKLEREETKLLNVWWEASGGKKLEDVKNWEKSLNQEQRPEVRELFNANHNLERRIRAEVQEFCHGVVEIREYMWT